MSGSASDWHWRASNAALTTYLLVPFLLFIGSRAFPLHPDASTNATINLPQGTTYNTQEQLLCTPSTWKTVWPFFLANYAAHVATIVSLPGESALSTFLASLTTLGFPSSGMVRGLNAIFRCAIRGNTPLEKACKAGALCVVIRTRDWKPSPPTDPDDVLSRSSSVSRPPSDSARHPQNAGSVVEMQRLRVDGGSQDIAAGTFQNEPPVATEQELPIDTQQTTRLLPEQTKPHGITSAASFASSSLSLQASVNTGVDADSDAAVVDASRETAVDLERLTAAKKRSQIGLAEAVYIFHPAERWNTFGHTVHSRFILPPGYAFLALPSTFDTARLVESTPQSSSTVGAQVDSISMSYSMSKGVIALFQILYASFTLYQSRGDQIQRFGYAAFGLTVTPYLVMSFVNLAGSLLTPDFPSMYLVRDAFMTEVEERTGSTFERVVATIRPPPAGTGVRDFAVYRNENHYLNTSRGLGIQSSASVVVEDYEHDRRLQRALIYLNIVISSIPIVMIAGLTRFRKGESSHAERAWIMTWIVFGSVFGINMHRLVSRPQPRVKWSRKPENVASIPIRSVPHHRARFVVVAAVYSVPAIGGFVVVAQMLQAYGNCTTL